MLGLVLEGGGMRAGFVAGALMALMDKGLTDFDDEADRGEIPIEERFP
jgi:predicted patatin/cPLA2 family phospholipase